MGASFSRQFWFVLGFNIVNLVDFLNKSCVFSGLAFLHIVIVPTYVLVRTYRYVAGLAPTTSPRAGSGSTAWMEAS